MKPLRLFPALLLVLTASCQKEQTNDVLNTQGLTISSRTMAMNGETAVEAKWSNGDCMGVFFGGESSAVKFTYNDGSWSTATTSVSAGSTIAAYTPWADGSNRNSVTILPNQSTADGIRNSDFLYAEGSNATIDNTALNLTFDHRLSQLIVKYTYIGEMTNAAPADVKILNQPLTYSNSNGTWAASGDANSVVTPLVKHGTKGGTIEAILVPHTVASGTEFMTFTINDIPYTITAGADWVFEPGKCTTLKNLSISPDNAQILNVTCSVGDWLETTATGSLTEISAGYEEVNGVYYIYNAKGLETWGTKAATGSSLEGTLKCVDAVLMNDIDMEGKTWPSCCRAAIHRAYTGTFDGNGHTISNLTVKATWDAVGFIGSISTGTVKNLTIDGIKVNTGESQSSSNMGAIVGEVTGTDGKIENCHVIFRPDSRIMARKTDASTFDKQGTYNAGGIVGLSYGNITGCTVKADAPAQNGGEIGFSKTPDNYHIQSITYSGGIAGKVYADIENCHVDGIHLFCTTSGGIVGETNADGIKSVIACSSKDVTIRGFMGTEVPSGLSVRAGGLVGRSNQVKASTDILHVAGCYAMGTDIQLDATQSSSQAGGLVARCQSGMVYITSSYAESNNLVAKAAKTVIAHGDGHFKQVASQKMLSPVENQGTQLEDIKTVVNNITTYNDWLTNPNQSERGTSFAPINWQYVVSDNNPFPMLIQPKN